MRGSSGALISVNDGEVFKYDTKITGTKVRDQGIWLHQHDESVILPRVDEVFNNGYVMEKLKVPEIPTTYQSTFDLCSEILTTLENHLWDLEFTEGRQLVEYNGYEHRPYVRNLLKDVGLRRLDGKLRQFYERIKWYDLKTGLTHGDGIIDNVAYRLTLEYRHAVKTPVRQLVLLDPIPACPALPDVVALDVGRVIQSISGYEVYRYNNDAADADLNGVSLSRRIEVMLNSWFAVNFNLNEARAALYFSIIHSLRGVRTAQRVAQTRVQPLVLLTEHLVKEAEKWMR